MIPSWATRVGIGLLALAALACSDDDPVQPHSRSLRTVRVAPDGSGQYPTIQAAIDASIAGDTILLDDGRFTGSGNRNLDFKGRDLVVRSSSGDPSLCIIGNDTRGQEEYRVFWFHSGETSWATIANLTIAHASQPWQDGGGSAALCSGASPTFRNVVFENNDGSAVRVHLSSTTFIDCIFEGNSGQGTAGALAINSGTATLNGCRFTENDGGFGGAIHMTGGTLLLQDCVFAGNIAGIWGGAIWARNDDGSPWIEANGCSFINNTSGIDGGALLASDVTFRFVDCVFAGNAASNGGGGAISSSFWSNGRMVNCVFYGNFGLEGAAIKCGWQAQTLIENTIIAFNNGSAAVYCDTMVVGPAIPEVRCSDIYGNPGGDWVDCFADQLGANSNISADPLFCDAESGDFRLMPASPLLAPCAFGHTWEVGCDPLSGTSEAGERGDVR